MSEKALKISKTIKRIFKKIIKNFLYVITRIHKIPRKLYALRHQIRYLIVYSYHHILASIAYNLKLSNFLFLQPIKKINLNKSKIKIAFVCTGNICRSPYAEAKMRSLVTQLNLNRFEISSYGTSTTPGKKVDRTALEIARTKGIDLSPHRTKQITAEIIKETDLIIFMGTTHYLALKKLDRNISQKSIYLGSILLSKTPEYLIDDPYGHDPGVFAFCYQTIDYALSLLLNEIRKKI